MEHERPMTSLVLLPASPSLGAVARRFAGTSDRWVSVRPLRNDSLAAFMTLVRLSAWLGDGLCVASRGSTPPRPVLHLVADAALLAFQRCRSADVDGRARVFVDALLGALWVRIGGLTFAYGPFPAMAPAELPRPAKISLQSAVVARRPPAAFVEGVLGWPASNLEVAALSVERQSAQ
jgi:hypothetical protein